jgi:subtilisin family serine protease
VSALVLALILPTLVLATFAPPARADSTTSGGSATSGAVLVRFRPDSSVSPTTSSLVGDALRRAGVAGAFGTLGRSAIYRFGVETGRDPEHVASALQQNPAVLYAEPDRIVALADGGAQPVTDIAGAQDTWAMDRIGASRVSTSPDSAPVTVAVLDTGVSPTHPDLAGRVLSGWNFVAGNADTTDDAGHGTYVAGIIAGSHDRSRAFGVAPSALILPVKILDASATGSTANFVSGVTYAVQAGARVINISAGGVLNSRALADAIADAEAQGVVVVSSAGNGGADQPIYPAALSTVLAVGATTRDDTVAAFSSTGAYVDLAAPGVEIPSTWHTPDGIDTYAVASGTSAAAPFVAGAAALLLSANPSLHAAEVRELLTESALDLGLDGIDARSGFGRLDVDLAVGKARYDSSKNRTN